MSSFYGSIFLFVGEKKIGECVNFFFFEMLYVHCRMCIEIKPKALFYVNGHLILQYSTFIQD